MSNLVIVIELFQYTLLWHATFQICTHIISPLCLCHYSTIYTKVSHDQRTYWNASMVSSIHAVVVSCLAMFAIVDGQLWSQWPHVNMETTTPWSHFTIKIMTSYLLSDAGLTIYYRSGEAWASSWKVNVAHHLVVGLINYNIIVKNFGHSYGLIGTMLEMTTPLVNTRWFLHTSGETSTILYLANGMALVLLWFVVRIVIAGPFTMYPLWLDSDDMNLGRRLTFLVTYGGVYPLQCWWFFKLARGAMKVLSKEKRMEKTLEQTKLK
jgi:hypothetical protein